MSWFLITLFVIAVLLVVRRFTRSRGGSFDWGTAEDAQEKGARQNRVFVVTGAASGIGRATTGAVLRKSKASSDIRVVACDLSADNIKLAADEDGWDLKRVDFRAVDVCDSEAWKRLYEEIESRGDRVVVHLNIAGFMHPGNVMQDEMQSRIRYLNLTVDVNVKGVALGSMYAADHMRRQGSGGQIINVTSMASLFPYSGCAFYGASKAAARSFSLAFGREVEDEGIYITAVAPDAVRTPMLDIQHASDAASISFSSYLEVEQVVSALLDHALPNKPAELWVPFHRGVLAMLTQMIWDTPLPRIITAVVKQQGRKAKESYVMSTAKNKGSASKAQKQS